MIKTLVNKVVTLPAYEVCLQIESYNKETDCYLLHDFHYRYKTLTISRHYLISLLDSGLSKILT
ncbi:hypothetical protein NIES2100_05510 [Calothrix sp. NIES-2100]|nr:hypothetical protein NIES2100_05510 [Calothrix sp. NIES-2100]